MGKDKDKKKDKKAGKKKHAVVEALARSVGYVAGAVTKPGEGVPEPVLKPTADLFSAISNRRSHRKYLPKPVDREILRTLLDSAVLAPNHKLTEPWGFVVLGDEAKRAFGGVKATRKFGDATDAESIEKAGVLIGETRAIPTIIAVTQVISEDPARREEDYAAIFMAIQNLLLAATAMGLGTKINTGPIMDDPNLRSVLGVIEGERIVALVNLGEPAEIVAPKKREPASEKTRWLD